MSEEQRAADTDAPSEGATGQQDTATVDNAARSGRDARAMLRQITESSGMVVFFAIVASMILGSILIAVASDDVREAAGNFFSSPGDLFVEAWQAISSAYMAIWNGAVFNSNGKDFAAMIKPLTLTLTSATPLIFAGLGLGVGFRAGLFNIGAQGQILMGATLGAMVGFMWDLPVGLHLLVAVLGCVLGGALWGFIPGLLKAKTGAHEVITTIMLNHIALNLVAYLLSLEAFQREGSDNPLTPPMAETARFPSLLGSSFPLHWGFVLALATAAGVWWLMERSTWGFQFRAVGANPSAARTAGMNVPRSYILVMVIAGALAGLAGSSQLLGYGSQYSLTADIAASIGFDAITVALLGRSRPLGTVWAAILFGGLKASGATLQVQANLPIDIVLVLQSLIVLFIAAPPLVRFLFRLPVPATEKEVSA